MLTWIDVKFIFDRVRLGTRVVQRRKYSPNSRCALRFVFLLFLPCF